ncbi:thiamine diphosphate-binding protein [Ustulina deusta]|nr:thiamine diphosphate-binding protein [Ustulina deusta]
MLRSRQAARAARALSQTSRQNQRPFTISPTLSAIQTTTKPPSAIRNQTTSAQSTPQVRDRPAPAFNIADAKDRNHVQPLVSPGAPAMDESFIGKTGGEIFHEMMRRHGVKHICMFSYIITRLGQCLIVTHSWLPWWGYPPRLRCYIQFKTLRFHPPRTGLDIWLRATPALQGNPALFSSHQALEPRMSSPVQEADVIGISRACTKWNVMVKDIAELPRRINEAFEIATSGRPGPVLVDLPKDVTAGVLRRAIPTTSALPGLPSAASRATMEATQKQLQLSLSRVGELINIAKRPVIYAGHGIITSENGPQLLKELADKASISVTTTLHGLGAFDELDEKSLYMLGMHGSAFANMAMQEADLIIALGSRFDDRVTLNVSKFAPAAKAAAAEGRGGIVHFEIMPKNINKVVQATEAIEGDVATNLAQLLPHVNITSMADRKEWFDKIKAWKEKWPMSDFERTERPGMIKPQIVIEQLSDLTANRKHETIITTGVGQHQMWTAQHFRWRHPRTMITSGGLGTMGYGLPAAIGAKVARPDALVVDIDGDASFNMTLTELSTAAQFNIGVKIIVLNNEEQGMVTQWQNLFYEDRYAHTHQKNPDFMKLADAMGVQHRRLIKPEDTQEYLKWLIESDGPALLEVMTDKKVPVLPMVPSGSGLHEFLVWDGEKDKKRRELMRSRTCGLHG